jgi:hypothetical protein
MIQAPDYKKMPQPFKSCSIFNSSFLILNWL